MRSLLVLLLAVTSPPTPQPAPMPDATPLLRGVVNTKTQAFGGFKMFDGGISAPNVVQATSGTVTYFVDGTLGNDSNACTSSGAGACLTIQGALNKAPKLLRHQVTVSIAAGTYAGFIVSGFSSDQGVQQVNSGLLVTGTLANSVIATGSAAGTATGGSGGTNQTFGTLIDSGQTWTTNDLVGRLLCTSNTTVCIPIETNTSTTVTIVGPAGTSGWVAPVGGVTTYAIKDSATIVNTAVTYPPSPLFSVNSPAAIIAMDNNTGVRDGSITLQNMMISNPTGAGIEFNGYGAYALNQMQVRPTQSTARGISGLGASVGGTRAGPQLMLENTDVFLSVSSREAFRWDYFSGPGFVGTQFRGTTASATNFGIFTNGPLNMQGSAISGFTNSIFMGGTGTTTVVINATHITCGTYTSSLGLVVGNSPSFSSTFPGIGSILGVGSIDHVSMSVCATGLTVDGPAAAELHGITGSVGTTLIDVRNGGYVGVNQANLTTASVTIGDGGTAQYFVDVDHGFGPTATVSTDLGASQNLGICISYLPQGSRACGR